MNHHFRGAKLAYRFDFSSSCLLPEAHMSVEPGMYATFEMAPLEVRTCLYSRSHPTWTYGDLTHLVVHFRLPFCNVYSEVWHLAPNCGQ